MTPPKSLIVLTFLFAATVASAQHCRKIEIDKSSGFCTVPDPKLTPGAMDASQACVSNNDRPDSVTTGMIPALPDAGIFSGIPSPTRKRHSILN